LFREYEVKLLQPLLDYASAKNSVRLIGPSDANKRAPTVALEVQGSPQELAVKLARKKIMAAGGDFYGMRPLNAMGVDAKVGVLRLSFVHYNDISEVNKLISALDELI
ncbi:MAG: aminotransferase class V-fold PLP-dependent enzyme, partial [Proteobacteria bacterium]|nr:aminotransferase class V-fold PLP-dependent enzyme [Pseudomonadota bacterium]